MSVESVYIGIGSNIGDSQTIVNKAILSLGKLKHCQLIQQSHLYRTEAIAHEAQNDYINAMVNIHTELKPIDLLLNLQSIEQAFYRHRALKWAPRTLDLDIILFGTRCIKDSHLTVPHPEMHHRLFVLVPLLEISGDMNIPGLGQLQHLVAQAPSMSVQCLSA